MMMKMLQAGGIDVLIDGMRSPNEDNIDGYFEYERVKELEIEQDKAWLHRARGKAIKVISHLLTSLPGNNIYRVILMRRDLREVLSSQNKMLKRCNESDPVCDQKEIELFQKHLFAIKVYTRSKRNFTLLEIPYHRVLDKPEDYCRQINEFLGGGLDVKSMAGVVNPDLYRNRAGHVG